MADIFNFKEGEVLLFDKPLGLTSFGVVSRVRGIIKRKLKVRNIKVGHAGTLDPLATGLLVICTGKMTKSISGIQDAEKEYTGTITLGSTTPSYDLETDIDQTYPTEHISEELIFGIAKSFVGQHDQMPPIFSAKQVDGKRAYELARKGKEVKLEPKRITIREFEITGVRREPELQVDFRVSCSKGTYIRSLAHDFGKAVGSGGHLSALRRTRIGNYNVNDAINTDQFQSMIFPDQTENS
ncbi:MAG: tRNA pseudouridine(55) synthase TruB [Flavobacteriales bacterium]|nr:tRNA pseudouridine(55) synthase TruB [Flavobacteriales bacterium]